MHDVGKQTDRSRKTVRIKGFMVVGNVMAIRDKNQRCKLVES